MMQKGQKGQAITEYIVMVAAVVSFYFVVTAGLKELNVIEVLFQPINKGYKQAYQFGDPNAQGFESRTGQPSNHPAYDVGQNGKFFANPSRQ